MSEFNDFISHGIDIRNLHFSTSRKVVLDTSTFEIYDCRSFASWELTSIASMALKGSAKFILDGQYIAMISKSGRELLLVRSCDGVQKGRIYIHGKAGILAVASDDRNRSDWLFKWPNDVLYRRVGHPRSSSWRREEVTKQSLLSWAENWSIAVGHIQVKHEARWTETSLSRHSVPTQRKTEARTGI